MVPPEKNGASFPSSTGDWCTTLYDISSPNLQPNPVDMAITIFVPAITEVTRFRFVGDWEEELVAPPFEKPF